MANLKIVHRFFIGIGFIFVFFGILEVYLIRHQMQQHALEQAESKARLLLDQNLATHRYFTNELRPTVFKMSEDRLPTEYFEPTWMSSTYAVRGIGTYFQELSTTDYYYKECAINARSPKNEADEFEKKLFPKILADQENIQWSGIRRIEGKPYYVLVRRSETMEETCLRCHGDPKDAPGDLVKIYGPTRSFNRKIGELISLASIRIPLSSAYSRADKVTKILVVSFTGILCLVIGIVTLLNKRLFISPLERIKDYAIAVAKGKTPVGFQIEQGFKGEWEELSKALNTMSLKLKTHQDELEATIQQRTKDLGREVKEHRDTEKARRESEALLQAAMDQSQAGIAIASAPDGKLRYVNDSGLGIRGKSKEEIVDGVGIDQYVESWRVIHSDGRPYDKDEVPLARAILYGETCSKECIIRRPDDSDRIVWANAAPIYNDEGKITAGIVVFLDITKRKRFEEKLEKLSAAVRQSPVSIVITDLDGNIEYVNPKFCALTGYSSEDVMGQNPRILQSGRVDMETYENLWQTLLAGNEWRGELQNRKKNGEIYWEDAIISGITNQKGEITHFLAVKEDITERKQFDERIRQAQKLESIGTLAGGIAHDFNNILFPIVGHTEMLLEDVPKASPMRDSLDEIYTGAMRAKELVSQILTFSRHEKHETKLMKINPILKECLKMIHSTIPSSIKLSHEVDNDCGIVKADPTHIHQLIMNLLTNAYHAIGDELGEIKIELKNVFLEKNELMNAGMMPGPHNCIRVSDTGMGMDETTKIKIFDPFFTTKEKGKGTGMGLSVVHGIIESLHGGMDVVSQVGKGTVFSVYIPVERSQVKKLDASFDDPILGGSEKILIVDDEESIVYMEDRMLRRLGYQVLSSTNSNEALRVFTKNSDKIDLVITDLAMPEMPGDSLALKLLAIRKDIPIILCTGFGKRITMKAARKIGIRDILIKPIVKKDLAQTIRNVLDHQTISKKI